MQGNITFKLDRNEFGLTVLMVTMGDNPSLEFDLTDFITNGKKSRVEESIEGLYTHFSDYLQSLPLEIQYQIYNILYGIYIKENKSPESSIEHVQYLEERIAQMVELVDYEGFKLYIFTNCDGIFIPENIQDVFIQDENMNTAEDKTYVKGEYIGLIALLMFIRGLSPMYVNYHAYVKKITSQHAYKLLNLFIRSTLIYTSDYIKLKTYVEETLSANDTDRYEKALVMNSGLSIDDIVDINVGEVIFNKLINIDFYVKKSNIVSFVFQTIKYKGNFTASEGAEIRNKDKSPNDPNKEDISYFEDYRKTSDIAIGTVVEIQHSLSDERALVSSLGLEDFDYDWYYRELALTKYLMDKRPDKVQVYLLGWFLSKIVNPRALYYIENKKLVELMLFAKVVLLSKGHNLIGMLMSSYKTTENNFINVTIKNTINKTLTARLSEFYGFVMGEEEQSVIERTISEISKEISNSVWKPIGTEDQLAMVANADGYLNIPSNLNEVVTDFVEFINKPNH